MCSNRSICGGNNRSNRSSNSEGSSSGAHYALCALGVGLIALGVVMIVWTVIPMDGGASSGSSSLSGNTTTDIDSGDGDDEDKNDTKSSTVAMVLVGVGVAMLLLSIFLGVRSKRRANTTRNQSDPVVAPFMERVPGEEAPDSTTYNVPSYEEVVGSGDYPVRQSNLRQSTSQLPSYEDIIAAVENEGTEPTNNPSEDTPLNDPEPAPAPPAAEPQADHPGLTSHPSLPTRSSSRASRLLRPLRVRRIKSDKLHLKDFRLQIRSPTQNPVNIEPITPPPQYENKMPELQ
ncbi:transmembrane protein 51b [Echeneis naucrates]|uniref:transmembrane protein 51b n=1 Tax=Echeneis naucrates TaxID=173247 RepID=UPI00111353FC|nr:transmembrane protein 51-like [Echeneis naucrates]XP_029357205.1 transmembrane protein 51-like [Echeneis naucrates]